MKLRIKELSVNKKQYLIKICKYEYLDEKDFGKFPIVLYHNETLDFGKQVFMREKEYKSVKFAYLLGIAKKVGI